MTWLLWTAAIFWTYCLVQLVVNRLILRDLSRAEPEEKDWPSVSIVVPARNEERSIREAVSSFCRQDYPAFEVIAV